MIVPIVVYSHNITKYVRKVFVFMSCNLWSYFSNSMFATGSRWYTFNFIFVMIDVQGICFHKVSRKVNITTISSRWGNKFFMLKNHWLKTELPQTQTPIKLPNALVWDSNDC